MLEDLDMSSLSMDHPSLPEALQNEKGYELLGILGSAPDSILRRHTVAMIELIDHKQAFLDGAAGRGQLIGHPAPEFDIEWINSDQDAVSLNAFKGKIVILDFWATWSGLCIKSFPKLRNLRDKYDQQDVAILGITSLQGQHFPSGKALVDTKGNPELERKLMLKFIKKMDISWPVAFSRQDVFNTEYGVESIPHLTILAQDGTVRYNGLSANAKTSHTMEKIDRLLAEAKDLSSEVSSNANQ